MCVRNLWRAAVCLVLIGCLLINALPARALDYSSLFDDYVFSSPFSVFTYSLEDELYPFPVELVAGSLLIGLGVLPGEDVSIWDSLVDGCIVFLDDYVEDGLFGLIVRYSDVYYIPADLVLETFYILFDLDILRADDSGSVSVHPDFTAGTFPLNPSSIYDLYSVWFSSFVELTISNTTLAFLPLGIAADYESTRTLTQEYVWSGGRSVATGLTSFFAAIASGLGDLAVSNLSTVFVAGLGLTVSPVIAWFGFRWVKRRVRKSFIKGGGI